MTRGQKSQEGDTRTSPNGYHYTRTKTKWELTGRLVGAKKIGRELLPNERIKYLDGNKLNNVASNIEVYVAKEGTIAKKRAKLEQKIADLQAELELLDAEAE